MPIIHDRSFNKLREEAQNEDYLNYETLDESVIPDDINTDHVLDEETLLESFIVDMVSSMNDDQKRAYLESDEFAALLEAGIASRRTVVRLNKNSDLERRTNLAALQMAKEKNDPDWEALRKNRIKERQLRERIFNKYGKLVRQSVVKAQKRLIALNPRVFDTMARDIR